MAATGTMTVAAPVSRKVRERRETRSILYVRLAVIFFFVAVWELLSRSGWFFADIIPSLVSIAQAMVRLLFNPAFWSNLQVTLFEAALALGIGTLAGVVVGIVLGANRFLGAAFEPYLYYFSPTPRIILFPIMIMWFGVGLASKVALGALASFFAVALSTAAGMRQIDKVIIRVGRSFRATPWQMATKIYLPAMRIPVLTGIRLGLGNALITVLLAETKLSNQGLGYMVNTIYQRFDIPTLYALLIIVFLIAGACNAVLGMVARRAQ
ncbi:MULTISPECIES: ABC transporter permease [unclassified Beijerinckia]|uniref:ABC transporter permease n=1 Tax=unclassified Beijerinckia TaxID=2638183 RepID=UPI0008947B2B|nr:MULTISPECIES: ABC transporter permease [unclassified Beijerinckia]MDH7798797.1 NitT/TauT family transport system permease protein [Beijerinckia sp. GAS462]SED33562.1 NitT/TauT family transport system permease protein [Beijerinckia sp. 28-YEA-48]